MCIKSTEKSKCESDCLWGQVRSQVRKQHRRARKGWRAERNHVQENDLDDEERAFRRRWKLWPKASKDFKLLLLCRSNRCMKSGRLLAGVKVTSRRGISGRPPGFQPDPTPGCLPLFEKKTEQNVIASFCFFWYIVEEALHYFRADLLFF